MLCYVMLFTKTIACKNGPVFLIGRRSSHCWHTCLRTPTNWRANRA